MLAIRYYSRRPWQTALLMHCFVAGKETIIDSDTAKKAASRTYGQLGLCSVLSSWNRNSENLTLQTIDRKHETEKLKMADKG